MIAGYWYLVWPDGVGVMLYRERRGIWRAGGFIFKLDPEADSTVPPRYNPRLDLPEFKAKTRRELISVLREWRRRESLASGQPPGVVITNA